MNVVSHNCPTCSAPLMFDVETQNWACDYCKKEYSIEELIDYIDSKEDINTPYLHGYACDNCGASIVTCSDNVSSICSYCGSPIIIKDQIEGEYKPDLIAPFKHTKEEFTDLFMEKIQKKLLSPKSFFNKKNIKSIEGVYIPFFVVSAEVSATIYGDARKSSEIKSSFMRKGTMKLENVPADAKTIIDNDFIRGLEPFEYKEFKKFEYPYLSGFYAEKYDDTKEDVYEEQINKRIEEAALEKVTKSGHRYMRYEILSHEVKTFCTEFKYALMPIWCIHMNYHNKDYVYYVNDQNLIIAGRYPVHPIREITACLTMILATLLLVYVSMLISNNFVSTIVALLVVLSWVMYFNYVSSYGKVKHNVKSKDYIKSGSFMLINSSDHDYSTKPE